jgi:hypothetical protein
LAHWQDWKPPASVKGTESFAPPIADDGNDNTLRAEEVLRRGR